MSAGMMQRYFPLCLLLAGMVFTNLGCDSGSLDQETKSQTGGEAVTLAAKDATQTNKSRFVNDQSVKVLTRSPEFALVNQDGEHVNSDDYFGRVWVANFIFTQCKGTCPLQTEEMKKIQRHMKLSPHWKDLNIVSFSVDPEFDTPEVMSQYITDHNVDELHWDFLTGTRSELWSLIKSGFKLPVAEDSANTDMPIMHSTSVVLVDWEGRIRGYYDGLDAKAVEDLKDDMDVVLNERLVYPQTVLAPEWVYQRSKEQLEAASEFEVFHDFKFVDQQEQSGITFRNKVVDDAARNYKAVHYDHGNAIAIADVDGDGLYDIYFSTQAGSSELWRNMGNGRFDDITDGSGLLIDDRIGVGASFADIDNDGDPDLFTTSVRVGNQLFENDGKGHFTDITKESGLGHQGHSSGAVFFDYDRDGLLDLFLSNVGVYTHDETANVTIYTRDEGHTVSDYKYYLGFVDAFAGHLKPERTETSILYRNMGGNRFEDVSEETGLIDKSWTGDSAAVDFNTDGWPDLYVINMEGHDEYYENIQGKRFERKGRELFPMTPWGAMGVKTLDFDNDGDFDLFVTDMHSDMSEVVGPDREKQKASELYPESFLASDGNNIHGNAFYLNEGDGTFTEISEDIGAETFWPWGLSSGDVNADGFEDVFITAGMNYPFRYAVNSLLLNDRGAGFLDSEYVLGVEPRLNNRTAVPWFEVHCPILSRDNQKLCEGQANGRKVVWSSLASRSSVIFDLDQDGDLDIVTQESNTPPMVLISNLSEQQSNLNFIKIKLIGNKSNRGGIGATIRVFSNGHIYTKTNDGKSGYLSQSLYPVYFGLGDSGVIEKIEVSWPSGGKQIVDGPVVVNRLLEIKEQ